MLQDASRPSMHEYDVAIKLTFQQVDCLVRELTGTTVKRWLNIELPEVRNTRVDLLGETPAGDLVHIELQSTNDTDMAQRMDEYYLRVFRQLKKFPHQVLLYIGEEPLRMPAELKAPAMSFSYRLIDIRELDGGRLLESPHIGDNIIAILARLSDPQAAVHRVLKRIGSLAPGERQTALKRLGILAGLRKPLYELIKQEVKRMPITLDFREHPAVVEEYQRGVQQGELSMIRRLLQTRFGALPEWADERLKTLTAAELEDLGVRVLNAESIEALFQ